MAKQLSEIEFDVGENISSAEEGGRRLGSFASKMMAASLAAAKRAALYDYEVVEGRLRW